MTLAGRFSRCAPAREGRGGRRRTQIKATPAGDAQAGSDDKKRARLNAMRYVLHSLPYTGKDVKRIQGVDSLLVGRANIIHERGEHDLSSGRYV